MDPYIYCQEALAELLDSRLPHRPHRAELQRAAVLAYLVQRRLSEPDFTRELTELAGDGSQGSPHVAAAARAILLDWQAATHILPQRGSCTVLPAPTRPE